jgi:putative GTP pyrophosphokinase
MSFNDIGKATEIQGLMLKYGFALETLETQLDVLIKEFQFTHQYNPVEHVKSRIKSEQSALKKLEKKGLSLTVDNIIHHVHDMIGIRIVCSFLSDVYDIANMIKNSPQLQVKEEKDYIQTPKDSGYISYHLIVLVPIYLNGTTEYVEAEIQIRTIAMDFWASLDHKIHYKFPKTLPLKVQEDLYQCSLAIKSLDNRMNELNEFTKNFDQK